MNSSGSHPSGWRRHAACSFNFSRASGHRETRFKGFALVAAFSLCAALVGGTAGKATALACSSRQQKWLTGAGLAPQY